MAEKETCGLAVCKALWSLTTGGPTMLVEVFDPGGEARLYDLDAGDICPVCGEGELLAEPVGDGTDEEFLICDYCHLEYWPAS
ncbi:MAG: hypothetical protein ACUVRO_00765 [Armatimonadota bacterium]